MKKWLLAVMITFFTMPVLASHPFIGVWAENQQICREDLGDNTPMTISATEIISYESECSFRAVSQPSADTWVAQMECYGEGETWDDNVRMIVSNDIMIFSSENQNLRDKHYIRCP